MLRNAFVHLLTLTDPCLAFGHIGITWAHRGGAWWWREGHGSLVFEKSLLHLKIFIKYKTHEILLISPLKNLFFGFTTIDWGDSKGFLLENNNILTKKNTDFNCALTFHKKCTNQIIDFYYSRFTRTSINKTHPWFVI